ncbi:four helix bundle protein [Salinimicrobium gaetbulicola]|uniref:Four helix bundle protein n=1 Tax=Salinimicrobium gaetbulicola TaxID=999702 RepID=A0ABW3IE22_9FLAO
MAKSYRDLEIYTSSLQLFYQLHPLSLQLPKYELYKLGSQVRRSSDSIVTNIVEGYGRKKYKADFLKFLIYAHSSSDETICHLEKLNYLYPEIMQDHKTLKSDYEILGSKILAFIRYVENS